MISSKGIRTLCGVIMVICYVLAFFAILYGCLNLEEGIWLIAMGILVPLIVSVALYPVYALSLIESDTEDISYKLDRIIELLENNSSSPSTQQNDEEPQEDFVADEPTTPEENTSDPKQKKDEETLNKEIEHYFS